MYKSFFFLVIGIAALAGCNTVNSVVNPPAQTAGSMTATVNGASWTSVIPVVTGGAKASLNGNILTVTGISVSDNSQITVAILNPAIGSDSLGASGAEGTYSHVIGVADTTVFISIPSPSFTSLYAGAVTVTAYDATAKTISGTFHFVGRLPTNLSDTVTVTNGSFYQVGW
jgi:hypothetical protein